MQDTKFECKKGLDFQIYFTGISTHLQTNNLKPPFVNFGYALCSSVMSFLGTGQRSWVQIATGLTLFKALFSLLCNVYCCEDRFHIQT